MNLKKKTKGTEMGYVNVFRQQLGILIQNEIQRVVMMCHIANHVHDVNSIHVKLYVSPLSAVNIGIFQAPRLKHWSRDEQ